MEERPVESPPPLEDSRTDLGFGSVVPRETRRRLLNRDGSFNVRREGGRFWESLSAYHYLSRPVARLLDPTDEDGVLSVDIRKLHDIERVAV